MITRIRNDHDCAIALEIIYDLDEFESTSEDAQYREYLMNLVEEYENREYGFQRQHKQQKRCK